MYLGERLKSYVYRTHHSTIPTTTRVYSAVIDRYVYTRFFVPPSNFLFYFFLLNFYYTAWGGIFLQHLSACEMRVFSSLIKIKKNVYVCRKCLKNISRCTKNNILYRNKIKLEKQNVYFLYVQFKHSHTLS